MVSTFCFLGSSNSSLPIPQYLTTSPSGHRLLHRILLFPIPTSKLPSSKANFIYSHTHHQFRGPSHLLLAAGNGEPAPLPHGVDVEADKEQARDAVSEILQQFGATKEESIEIALKSPTYINMLMGSVSDLDEWNSWSSSSDAAVPRSTFRDKVYQMAQQKGDKGILPFLESIGLSLSSAMHVARYLSSQTLPALIPKVKYVREIFFSDSADGGHLGRVARRMMMHLSIPVDEDVQQTLSFFEKIQARRGGLDSLGAGDASFRHLIESFPRLLLLPVESHVKPMVEFLEDIGTPRGKLRNVFLLFPPILFLDIEKDIKPRLWAFEKENKGDKDLGRMLVKYPWMLSTGIQANYVEILSFFDKEKVPKAAVNRAIESWPHLLGCSTVKLKLMVDQFGELGIKNKKLGQVIATSPQLLVQKPPEFLQVVDFLKDLGLDEETVGRILARCPEIFATNIEKTLKKKLEFLNGIGVTKSHLPRVVRKYPELFVCDIDKALRPRLNYLTKIGLSSRDVAFMVRRFSPLLGYSIEEVLRPKVDFLVKTMEKPISDVVDYPRYFSYSLEKKIEPRYRVLKGRNQQCSLKDMLGKNDEEFAAQFMGVGRMLVPPS